MNSPDPGAHRHQPEPGRHQRRSSRSCWTAAASTSPAWPLWDGAQLVAPAGTTLLDSSHLYVTQVAAPRRLRHARGQRAQRHQLGQLRHLGARTFVVGGTPPTVTTFSPGLRLPGRHQRHPHRPGLRLPGSDTIIQLQAPGGAWTSLTTSVTDRAAVTATVSFTSGQPAGDYLVRLYFNHLTTSATQTFRLLSNQAILQSATPRSAAQGTSTTVTMTVANLRPSGAPRPTGSGSLQRRLLPVASSVTLAAPARWWPRSTPSGCRPAPTRSRSTTPTAPPTPTRSRST